MFWKKMKEIGQEEFRKNQNKYTLVDVREPDERAIKSIEPALAIPLGELKDRYREIPLDKPIVCMCARGGRSAKACQFLAKQGIEAINLKGGIMADGFKMD